MKQGVLMEWGRIREILRLWGLGQSQGAIALSVGVARSTVQDYQRRAQAAGVSVEKVNELSEAELLEKLGKLGGHRERIPVVLDYAWITDELRKKGVTLDLLFRELVRDGRMPVSYPTFCRRIKDHEKSTGVVLRQIYNPGEYWLIDYAGLTVPIWDSRLQNILFYAQIFVGVLGASGLIFCEATPSQKIEHFLGSHVRAFEFYGGVPLIIVPDNLKSGVKKVSWHEPELTRSYQELSEHYGIVVLPARVRKPRDKGKVERAVLEVERSALAPLRNHKFTSVAALNAAMRPLLQALNEKQMRDYGASRQELFGRFEKSALKSLPVHRFEVTRTKLCRVNIDYHIEFEKHWYSVPYRLVHQEVWVKAGEFTLTVYCENRAIATHSRSRVAYRYTTLSEHMPAHHQAIRSRSAANFLAWAETVGVSTKALIEKVLSTARHEEQAYRSILGIQRLSKTYSPLALEAAALCALKAGTISSKSLRSIIARHYAERLKQVEQPPFLPHVNLRDPNSFN